MINKPFSIIAAINNKSCIGANGKLLWNNKQDLAFFKKVTYGSVVIMGRKTADSIREFHKNLLPNRINIVLTSNITNITNIGNTITCKSWTEVNEQLERLNNSHIFVIGGGKVYADTINSKFCRKLYLTNIDNDLDGDTYFPAFEKFYKVDKVPFNDNNYCDIYERNLQEYKYLELLEDILKSPGRRLFGASLKFNIDKTGDMTYKIPIMTTKRVFFRGIFEELKFFLNGFTDTKKLKEKGVNIWNGNTTRKFLDSRKLYTYPEGEAGPIYGAQWNNFGGFNQLDYIVRELGKNPGSRRALMSAWNPPELKKMCLPPCHVSYQFLVEDGHLHCVMYQRSADVFLGLPFNIGSTSLLAIYVANILGLEPSTITINIGDAHIYKEHIEACKEQLERIPFDFPEFKMPKKVKNWDDVRNMEYSKLINYKHCGTIKAPLIT